LKTTACDKLLESRVDAKLSLGRVKSDVMSRISVALPKPRDNKKREAFVPESVLDKLTSNNNKGMDIGESFVLLYFIMFLFL
jgi:nucleolar GTP-binding protein